MGTVHRQIASSDASSWDYADVAVKEYSSGNASPGSTRRILVGQDEGERNFIIRYFTIPVNGHSAHEHHAHPHGVVVVQGQARVLLGETWYEVGVGDSVYIEADEQHQFQNTGEGPLGFICVIPSWAKAPGTASE